MEKFASGIITKDAGEKEGEEWINTSSLDWPSYLSNLKQIVRF